MEARAEGGREGGNLSPPAGERVHLVDPARLAWPPEQERAWGRGGCEEAKGGCKQGFAR